LNAEEPLALEIMGTYYFLHNQPEQARLWLSRALDADRSSYSAALYMALLSETATDRERYLQLAVKARPDHALAWQRLWTLYVEDGRAEQARRLCRRSIGIVQPWLSLTPMIGCEGQGEP
jgi:tetratricopeptide (TPR) repeat protein